MTLALTTPAEVYRLLDGAGILALDLETTGLNPRTDRIRLLSLSDGKRPLVMDCFEHDIRPILPALTGKILVAHHALFDLGFLWHQGLRDLPETICTYLMAQLLTAGEGNHGFGSCNLASCCQRWLGQELDKEQQRSDWSGSLTQAQIDYAARDVEVLLPLFQALTAEMEKAKLVAVSEIELRALPAFVWLTQSGVPFDRQAWLTLADQAAVNKGKLAEQLDGLAPPKGSPGLFGPTETWNWDSPQQVHDVLLQLGLDVTTTRDAQLALLPGEFAARLRDYRHQAQLLKMYGLNWLNAATIQDGRLYPTWRQLGAASGRTSCESPNCQQIPRDSGYRKCFRAAPGKVLVKCDYATLQMRIACNQAQDQAMLQVFQAEASGGSDVHTATARMLLGKQDINKQDRQIAKSAGFGLLFGMSAEGLQVYARMTYGIEFSAEEAKSHREAWLRAYPGIAKWQTRAYRDQSKETRSTTGRRRLLFGNPPATWRLNSPVQADEADGLKTALGLLWKRRREHPDAVPVLAVHDEIVLECPAEQGEAVAAWLKECMVDAMGPILDPVPCEVEAKIVPTWGG